MFSQRHFLRLLAIVAATISVGQPFRIASALNQSNFRGHVHWSAWLVELVSIAFCFVLALRLYESNRSLSRTIHLCAWVGIVLSIMLGASPTPGRWWGWDSVWTTEHADSPPSQLMDTPTETAGIQCVSKQQQLIGVFIMSSTP